MPCYNDPMDSHPYHHYLFFKLGNEFYQLPKNEQDVIKERQRIADQCRWHGKAKP